MPQYRQVENLFDMLGELRLAKRLAGGFVEMPPREQAALIAQLLLRIELPPVDAPAVCHLDTGVNRGHPLLDFALAEDDLLACGPLHAHCHPDRRSGGGGDREVITVMVEPRLRPRAALGRRRATTETCHDSGWCEAVLDTTFARTGLTDLGHFRVSRDAKRLVHLPTVWTTAVTSSGEAVARSGEIDPSRKREMHAGSRQFRDFRVTAILETRGTRQRRRGHDKTA